MLNTRFNTFNNNSTNISKPAGTTNRKSLYFCSVERSFKLNGYPHGFKGFKDKKVTTAVSQYDFCNSQDTSLSVAQYTQLMDMLNKQHSNNKNSSTYKNITAQAMLAGNFCLLSNINTTRILDSGATDHICSNLYLFGNYTKVEGFDNTIIVPDGRRIPILHVGLITLNDQIQLHNVLHVPDFHFYLSVKRLLQMLSSGCFH